MLQVKRPIQSKAERLVRIYRWERGMRQLTNHRPGYQWTDGSRLSRATSSRVVNHMAICFIKNEEAKNQKSSSDGCLCVETYRWQQSIFQLYIRSENATKQSEVQGHPRPEGSNCQALSISQSLNLSLSLRDRDRADTEVKIRSPNQGLGSIPASKKWSSGTDPRVQKIMLWDQSFRFLVLWSQNSIFLVLGFDVQCQRW